MTFSRVLNSEEGVTRGGGAFLRTLVNILNSTGKKKRSLEKFVLSPKFRKFNFTFETEFSGF
jgi:hypothetical protein